MNDHNATSFGRDAAAYRAGRPTYPEALFDWIAREAPGHERVWDVGCGTGQASLALAGRFSAVHATDVDPAQLVEAPAHPAITYAVADAADSGLDDHSCDAVTVATALHWFDFPRFWPEVTRTARPGALFCAWVYGASSFHPEIDRHLVDPVLEVVAPYWADGNRLSFRGYPPEEIGFPYPVVEAPAFACDLRWTVKEVIGFLRTWSGYRRAAADGQGPRLAELEAGAADRFGAAVLPVTLPLTVRAGRVGTTC